MINILRENKKKKRPEINLDKMFTFEEYKARSLFRIVANSGRELQFKVTMLGSGAQIKMSITDFGKYKK